MFNASSLTMKLNEIFQENVFQNGANPLIVMGPVEFS